MPLGIPLLGGGGSPRIVDLVLGEVHEYAGGTRTVRPTGPEHAEFFDTYQGPLIEGIIQESEDDALLDRYLEGEDLGFETIETELLTAVANGTFHPVIPLSVETGAGVDVLLHLIEAAFPADPATAADGLHHAGCGDGPAIEADPAGPLVAEVVKTTSDAYVGAVALVRVFSGTLPAGPDGARVRSPRAVRRPRPGGPPGPRRGRAGRPAVVRRWATALRPKNEAIAGDLVVVAKLPAAQTSDTLSTRTPAGRRAVGTCRRRCCRPPSARRPARDEDKLPNALQRLAADDPSLRVEHNAETAQVVLWTTGQTHLDLVMTRLNEQAGRRRRGGARPDRACGRRSSPPPAARAGTSSSPAGTASTRCATSPSSRSSAAPGSSSSTGRRRCRTPAVLPSVEKGVRPQLEKGCLAG